MAMSKGISIPAVFHDRFKGVENVFIEFMGSYRVYVRAAILQDKSGIVGSQVKLERSVKQRKKKIIPRIHIPFSDEIWNRLIFYKRNAGQPIKLTFENEGDYLSIKFELV
jgi:hypothetical protein